MILLFCMLVIGSAVAQSINTSVSDLSANYFQDVFLESASRIPNIPIPNACQIQLMYMSKNWKTRTIFPSKYEFFQEFLLNNYRILK